MWGIRPKAWFENCEIYSRGAGYLAAQSSDLTVPYGFVYNNCQLTHAPSVSDGTVTLARPWHDDGSVTYLNCEMDSHIHPSGWTVNDNLTLRFSDYNSSGPGGTMANRVDWPGVSVLNGEEVALITLQSVLGEWSPEYAEADRVNDITVDAGSNQIAWLGKSGIPGRELVNLSGTTVVDPPAAAYTLQWTMVSGPAAVTPNPADAANASVTISVSGTAVINTGIECS